MDALLDQAAARFGDHPAFVFFQTGERLTFRDLKERADRLAAALARLGVVKGTHVALMVPNGPAFPVTWLALARLGAVMIPVNNRYTARELSYVLRDADADFLVIHSDYLPGARGGWTGPRRPSPRTASSSWASVAPAPDITGTS